MSTSNQHQRGGRRQPFGFLNANTLSSATKVHGRSGSGSDEGGNVGIAASASHSYSDPVKDESRKNMRCILSSIVTRNSGKEQRGTKNERGRSGSSDEDSGDMLESPTKKTRVTMEEDSKPCADDAAAAMPSTKKEESPKSSTDEFATMRSDVASVFRQPPDADFWNDEMEDMLELRLANPILDDGADRGEDRVDGSQGKADPSAYASLTRELDENVSGEPISWSDRLQEDEDVGFKIHVDR